MAIWFGLQHTSLGGIWDSIDIGGTIIYVCDIIFDFSVGYNTFTMYIKISLNVILTLKQMDINCGRSKYMSVDRVYIYHHITRKKKEENSTISPAKRRNHKRHLKSDPQIKSWIEIIEVEVRFQVDGTPRMINSTKPCHSSIVYNIVNP